ncbi:MAG: NAD(P)-dependent oxidoreductase [Tolumonas sp.]|nr:NAD(P)-dependent oxidoreductase [Tolumonas sp.]
MMNISNVAFIGLGVMGSPMAGYLQNKGFNTTVYNRTHSKAETWQATYHGVIAATPKQAATDADIVFICVGNDNDVRSVCYGEDGILAGLKPGAIVIDHTTASATLAHELENACHKQGNHFMDCPVSGGQSGAEKGCLTIMCGGDEQTFAVAKPVMDAYARQIQLVGRCGAGQRCKMVNQICIAGVLQGLSEGLLLAETVGLDIHQVVETLKFGAAGSWQMENRAETMAQNKFSFGFAIDWMRKDLGICLEEAARQHIELPLTKQVDERYAKLQEEGCGRLDTSALILSLKK